MKFLFFLLLALLICAIFGCGTYSTKRDYMKYSIEVTYKDSSIEYFAHLLELNHSAYVLTKEGKLKVKYIAVDRKDLEFFPETILKENVLSFKIISGRSWDYDHNEPVYYPKSAGSQ